MDQPPPRTLLEQLVRRSRRTIEENCVAFEQTAGKHGEKATLSPRHLARWMAGKVSASRPVAQRVAFLHWGYDFERLIGPPLSEAALTRTGAVDAQHEDMTRLPVMKQLELLRHNVHDVVVAGHVNETTLDEWEGAVHAHGLATRFRPNEAQLRFHQGSAHTHMHDTGAARAAQQRALDLYPYPDFLDRAMV